MRPGFLPAWHYNTKYAWLYRQDDLMAEPEADWWLVRHEGETGYIYMKVIYKLYTPMGVGYSKSPLHVWGKHAKASLETTGDVRNMQMHQPDNNDINIIILLLQSIGHYTVNVIVGLDNPLECKS